MDLSDDELLGVSQATEGVDVNTITALSLQVFSIVGSRMRQAFSTPSQPIEISVPKKGQVVGRRKPRGLSLPPNHTLGSVYSASPTADSIARDEELPTYSLQEVSYHDMPGDCWTVIYDRVYDVTDFLNEHPGGDEVMLEYAGRDATIAFRGVGHSKMAEAILEPYLIGILVEKERLWRRLLNARRQV